MMLPQGDTSRGALDFFEIAASVAGGVVSLALIVALFRAGTFLGRITQTIKQLCIEVEHMAQTLERAVNKQTEVVAKVDVMWEGRDRRTGTAERRRTSSDEPA